MEVDTLDVNIGESSRDRFFFDHHILIQGVADTPGVEVLNLTTAEDTRAPLFINVSLSPDDDNSERLSVRLGVPMDSTGAVIGELVPNRNVTGVSFSSIPSMPGFYWVNSTLLQSNSTPGVREQLLNDLLFGGIDFVPRPELSIANVNISVEVFSTEQADSGRQYLWWARWH